MEIKEEGDRDGIVFALGRDGIVEARRGWWRRENGDRKGGLAADSD